MDALHHFAKRIALDSPFTTEQMHNKTFIDDALRAQYLGDKGTNIAPFFISTPADMAMAGVVLMQVLQYWGSPRSKTDPWIVKALVMEQSAVSIVASVLSWGWTWSCFVSHYGSFWAFTQTHFLRGFYFMFFFQTVPLQLYFGHKAWVLNGRNYVLPVIAGAACLVGSGGLMALFATLTGYENLLNAPSALVKLTATMYLFSYVICDLVITLSILFALVRARTGWTSTNSLITKLILVTFETQAPPTMFTLICAIHYSATLSIQVAIPYIFISGKLYACALLVTLNARDSMLARAQQGEYGNTYALENRSRQAPNLTVQIATETFVERDEMPIEADHKRHNGLRWDGDEDVKEPSTKTDVDSLRYDSQASLVAAKGGNFS